MDPSTQRLMMGAAGAGAGAAPVYVEDVFSTWLYTGNGSTQTITNGIDLSGKGGLVWLKRRNDISEHGLYDTARGAAKLLQSQSTAAQISTYSGVSAFAATGFDLGTQLNASGGTYASWTFRKAAKFFDVVTWTGDGTSNRNIAHSLGSTPGAIIVKKTSAISNWKTYHRSLPTPTQSFLILNGSDAVDSGSGQDIWNPTSTTFAANSVVGHNDNGGTYVAYLFAHDAGGFGDSGNDSVVKCGSFTADGSGNATVTLGWEPQWVLFKRSDSSTGGSWFLVDSMRGMPVGGDARRLLAESSAAEANFGSLYPTATGFASTAGNLQASGTYIYIAIRRGPMKTPTDATKVFAAIAATASTGTSRSIGFPSDLIWARRRDASNTPQAVDRLRGLGTSSSSTTQPTFDMAVNTNAESTGGSATVYDVWNDTAKDGSYFNGLSTIWHHFRRAPGFFDVVAYTGTGANRTVSHNLGVAPEMMIVKRRNLTQNWTIYCAGFSTPTTSFLRFTNGAVNTGIPEYWNSTAPTSTVFSLGTDNDVNASTGTFIAYLFASCPGVSKVGSYTGTGTTLSVDCGFTNGARFVLIKRTDSTGDWYVWDTARGIIAADDPYLLLNSTAAEVTNTDYIDPLNSGFQISSTAPAAINASGGSFIYLAIA